MSDPALADGRYEVMVLDATPTDDDDGGGGGGSLHLTVTTVAGPLKGHVVELVAHGLRADPLDLLGTPATLVVEDGRPRLEPA